MADSSNTTAWVKFFTDGGIPHNVAANYAVTFVENRITKSMLLDLNKEILHDMGILVMGDIIAILKHAKVVHAQMTREKVYQEGSPVMAPVSPARRSTPVTRILDHYTQRESQSPSSPTSLKRKCEEEIPVPKIRRVLPEHEGIYKVTMPAGNTPKTRRLMQRDEVEQKTISQQTSVFKRLAPTGGTSTGIKPLQKKIVAKQKEPESNLASSVFARLGPGKGQVSSTTTLDIEENETSSLYSPLEYKGILKPSPTIVKIPAQRKKISAPTAVPTKAANAKTSLAKRLGPITVTVKEPISSGGLKVKRVLQGSTISSCSEGILASRVTSTTQGSTVKSRLGDKPPTPIKRLITGSKTVLTKPSPGIGNRKVGINLGKTAPIRTTMSITRTVKNVPTKKTTLVKQLRAQMPSKQVVSFSGVFSRLGPASD